MRDIIIGIILCVIFFIVLIVIFDVNRFITRKYVIKSNKMVKPYHFIVLSDLHNKQFGKQNKRLLRRIHEINPEAIYIAGDMLTAVPGKDFSNTVKFIRTLADSYPIYYGSGNHEYRMGIYKETYGDMGERYEEAIKHPNIVRLHTGKSDTDRVNVKVFGIEIDREYYKKFFAPKMPARYTMDLVGELREDEYNILIAHNPKYFKNYANSNVDLVLSGHVHGGIAKLPLLGGVISPTFRLFPKYDGGIFTWGNSTMVLSRGLGCHTIPIRFLNPGELVDVTIQP